MKKQKIYNTNEELREALNNNAKKYYQEHKNDPKFKEKRRKYYKGYYKSLSDVRKQAYRTYNSEYSFYIRSVVTGLFEKKIIKNKEKLKELEHKIFEMEYKLKYMKNKFGHLKVDNNVK